MPLLPVSRSSMQIFRIVLADDSPMKQFFTTTTLTAQIKASASVDEPPLRFPSGIEQVFCIHFYKNYIIFYSLNFIISFL